MARPTEIKRSLGANVAAQYAATLASYGASFFIAPVFIDRLGLNAFGVWAVTGALAQYASVLDFGVTRSLARFVGVYGRDDRHRANQLMGLGCLTAVTVTMFLAAVCWVAAPAAVALVHHAIDVRSMRPLLLASVGILGFSLLMRVFSALPTGLEDLVTPAWGTICGAAINLVVSIATLELSRSLVLYAATSALSTGLAALITFGAVVRRRGWFHLTIPSRELIADVAAYSAKGQIPWVLDLLNFQTDKVVLSALVDVRAAAAYELVNRIASAARQLAISIQGALMPRAIALIRREGIGAADRFGQFYTAQMARTAFPIFAGLSVAGNALMLLWLGRIPHDSTVVMVGLNVAYAVNALSGPSGAFALADGAQAILIWPAIITASCNLILTAGLGPIFGVVGVLTGTVVAFTVGSVLGVRMFCLHYGVPGRKLGVASLVGAPSSLAVVCAEAALLLLVYTPHTRLAGGIAAVALGAPFMALLGFGLRQTRAHKDPVLS